MRNRKSNPEDVSPRDLTHCSHKPECIVTTNPDRSVLITIITWHFQFRPVNVSILHLNYDFRAGSESRFACYSHCYVTWYPLTAGIVTSQCPSARDAVLATSYLTPFISACLNSFLRFLPQYILSWKCLCIITYLASSVTIICHKNNSLWSKKENLPTLLMLSFQTKCWRPWKIMCNIGIFLCFVKAIDSFITIFHWWKKLNRMTSWVLFMTACNAIFVTKRIILPMI